MAKVFTIYGTTTCPNCNMLHQLLKAKQKDHNNLCLVKVNFDEPGNEAKLEELRQAIYPEMSMPVLECDGEYHPYKGADDAIDWVMGILEKGGQL